MGLQLAPLSARITGDMTALKASMTAAVNEARAFKTNFEGSLAGMKVPPLDATGAVTKMREQVAVAAAKAEVAGAGKSEGVLASLREETGRHSTIGQVGHLAMGGGAIIGLQLAAEPIVKAADAAEKFALAIRKGGDEARKMAAEFVTSIPIVGRLGEAGYKLWGIFSGETQYVARMNDELAAQEVHMKNVAAAAQESAKWQKDSARAVAEVKASIQAIHMEGVPLELFKIDKDLKDKIAGVKEALPGVTDATGKAFTDEILANKKELSRLHEQLSAQKEVLAHRGIDVSQGIPNTPTQRGWTGAETGLSRQLDEAKHTQDQITMYNEKNRKLREQIGKDEATAAAAAQSQITAFTQEATEKRAKVMRDAVLGPMAADWNTFTGNVVKAWQQTGEDLAREDNAIRDSFDAIRREVSTSGMSSEAVALFDFKADKSHTADAIDAYGALTDTLRKTKEHQKALEDVRDWKRNLEGPVEKYDEIIAKLKEWRDQGDISPEEFTKGVKQAKDELGKNVPPEQRPETRFASFMKAGGADQLRLQFSQKNDAAFNEKNAEKTLAAAKEQAEILKSIDDRLAKLEVG